jgi:hypothetical protein
MDTRKSPISSNAIDLILHVGKDNYTVPGYIREAREWGVSKRIPGKSIPEGIVPGVSRLFLWHDEVIPIVEAPGKTLKGVVDFLITNGGIFAAAAETDLAEPWRPEELLLPADYVPPNVLTVTMAIQDSPRRAEIERTFDIRWQGGVFCWTYLGKIQCVLANDVEELPDEAKALGDAVEGVHIEYVGADGEPLEDEHTFPTTQDNEE